MSLITINRTTKISPVSLQRPFVRFLCTFMPYLVPPRGGVTRKEHWEQHPTIKAFHSIDAASLSMLDTIMNLAPDRNASILDMGCNVGRHLQYLHDQGYRNLRGVDFSSKAIADMAQHHPELYRDSRLEVASFEQYFKDSPETVDLVYTHGATFELVHPRFPLINRVCTIARRYVVMVINEWGHSYPRFWGYEFAREGFDLVLLRRPASPLANGSPLSLLVFERLQR